MKSQGYNIDYKHQEGFTFIELIIVVDIISILSAIALLVYNYLSTRAANRVHNAKVGYAHNPIINLAPLNNLLFVDFFNL